MSSPISSSASATTDEQSFVTVSDELERAKWQDCEEKPFHRELFARNDEPLCHEADPYSPGVETDEPDKPTMNAFSDISGIGNSTCTKHGIEYLNKALCPS